MEVVGDHSVLSGGSRGTAMLARAPGDDGSGGGGEKAPDRNNSDDSRKIGLRKRTKTGCLTCRRRRIKCDEGKPICNNCIKSKRPCEGYNKRVIFKDPMGAHPFAGPYGSGSFLEGDEHFLEDFAGQNIRLPSQGLLPLIAPKPPTFARPYQHLQSASYAPHVLELPPGADPVSFDAHARASQYGTQHAFPGSIEHPAIRVSSGNFGLTHYQPPNQTLIRPPESPSLYPVAPELEYYVDDTPLLYDQSNPTISGLGNRGTVQPAYAPAVPSRTYGFEAGENSMVGTRQTVYGASQDHGDIFQPRAYRTTYQRTAADDYSADSDSDMQDPEEWLGDEVGLLSRLTVPSGSQARSISAYPANTEVIEFIKALDFMCASELKDESKRRIFGHFIRVTGPSMSLYDRHPFDPVDRKNKERILSDDGCSIWTSTFPMKSFRHSGLLCAILAVGSLQIAHLKEIPPTVAIRQYAMAIRRIKKYTSNPATFTDPAMLAAILLLGYFEVWNSEHAKWCSHLLGARNIFRHIPLRELTRRVLPIKSRLEKKKQMERMGLSGLAQATPFDPHALDYDLLTTITGVQITPDDHGLAPDHQDNVELPEDAPSGEIDEYENFRDLFWWYCKMEIYQSILGATNLLMDYTHWTQCPPRAPMGNVDGVYGTYDHLMLLLGRLASFASKDWPRKRRIDQSRRTDSKSSSPPFPGMVPTTDSVRPSMNFGTATEKPTRGDPTDRNEDPSVGMQAAVEEWESIRYAFEVFETRLSNAFQPLSAQYSDRRDRPFGGVLQYRTYSIAGIWMNFYMGMIHLHRSHPSMPAAAIESAGRSAHSTAEYANKIGRIAIGLSGDCSHVTEISTLLGAAFIESAFCMFVAAVQFREADQRNWVVRRMHDISRLTGWRSAREIANGCESTWIKAAQLGKGPPYKRSADLDKAAEYGSIWDRPRRIDKKIHGVDEADISTLEQSRRAYYAVGLLALSEDMDHLELK